MTPLFQIRNLTVDVPGRRLLHGARTTITMAHDLRLQAVAEGVESEMAYNRLRAFGCDLVQGYLYARPMALPDLQAWLGRQRL